MAKSKAQKQREHLVRNGKRDPNMNRGFKPEISTHERKLPTLQEKRDKLDKKYKQEESIY